MSESARMQTRSLNILFILLPLPYRWGPVGWIEQNILVPAFLRTEIPGVETGAPAMPGRLVGDARNRLAALRTEETKPLVRDIFRACKQPGWCILL